MVLLDETPPITVATCTADGGFTGPLLAIFEPQPEREQGPVV